MVHVQTAWAVYVLKVYAILFGIVLGVSACLLFFELTDNSHANAVKGQTKLKSKS